MTSFWLVLKTEKGLPVDKPLVMVLVLVGSFPLNTGTGGGGVLLSGGFREGAWWGGAGCCSDSVKAEMPMD